MTRTLAALACTGTLLSLDASAADLNARDFFGAPPGTSLGVLYLPATRADDFHGPADSTGKAELKVNAVAYRQVFFSDLCGTLCTPQFILPFASYDFTPATYGALRLIHADGGELRIDDRRIDDTHKRYTQVGFEVGHWLDPQNQLMFGLSQNVATRNGYHGTDALLRLVHVF